MFRVIPLCYECANVYKQATFIDVHNEIVQGEEVVGCALMGTQEWEKGWYEDEKGLLHQHNCPIKDDSNG